jgi:hypothetical protein
MTQEEIYTSLDKMLANPKSKNFLNHLIRAYFPVSNVDKVWETPKGDFKCVLTREPLVSVQFIMEGMETEQFRADFKNSLKTMLDENADKTSPMQNLVGDKKLGLTGKDTTTFISYPAFQHFADWVVTKSLKGDKHINWLLGSIRRSTFIARAEGINDEEVQAKVQKINKPKTSLTITLGESNDVLANLKAKMEANGQ